MGFPQNPYQPKPTVKNLGFQWGRSFRDAKGVEVVLLEGAEALERNEEVETEVLDLRQAGERFFLRIIFCIFFWGGWI